MCPSALCSRTLQGEEGGQAEEGEQLPDEDGLDQDHEVSKVTSDRWIVNFAKLEATNYFSVKWATGDICVAQTRALRH